LFADWVFTCSKYQFTLPGVLIVITFYKVIVNYRFLAQVEFPQNIHVEENIVKTKRTISRPLILLSVITLLGLGLVACGSSGGGSNDKSEANTNCVLGTSTIGDCKI
jgi:hypothetical protein